MHYAQKLHENGGIKLEREKYGAGSTDSGAQSGQVDIEVDSTATAATADTLQAIADSKAQSAAASIDSKVDSSQSTVTAESTAPTLATLQSKLTKLQSKLHKEFRWYCDTILQGGSLAVRVAYRVHIATEVLSMVDRGEVCTDEAVVRIGGSLYTESDIDKLLTVEYLLDDLYDTWCKMSHTDEEWSDTVDRYLESMHADR